MPVKNSVVDAYAEILARAYSVMIKDQKETRTAIFETQNADAIAGVRSLYERIVSGINATREDVKEYERLVQKMVDGIPGAKMPGNIFGYYFVNFNSEQIMKPDDLRNSINPSYNEDTSRASFRRLLSAARNNKELDAVTESIVETNNLWDYLSETDLVALHLTDDDESE